MSGCHSCVMSVGGTTIQSMTKDSLDLGELQLVSIAIRGCAIMVQVKSTNDRFNKKSSIHKESSVQS